MKRTVVLLILDGVGIGALPDAEKYGDADANTLGNLSRLVHLRLPVLGRLGIGCLASLRGIPPEPEPLALLARLGQRSPGKDSTSGHWEHMGLVLDRAFPTFPQGFPPEILRIVEKVTGKPCLGNIPASGTEIIEALGQQHQRTGWPILYTSSDSVLQLAAHEDVVPRDTLYQWCQQIRSRLKGRYCVGRVIARPFSGQPGSFHRTPGRRDFSLEPPAATYVDLLAQKGVPVTGIGKVANLFAGRGFSDSIPTHGNTHGLSVIKSLLRERREGLLFVNLVDFDTEWGHRNDADGFASALRELDAELGKILALLDAQSALVLTADHGCDPTTVSTDHSREYVPFLLFEPGEHSKPGVREGWFSDTGATVWTLLTGEKPPLEGDDLRHLAPARSAAVLERPRRRQMPTSPAVQVLRDTLGPAPSVAVVLGSGLDAIMTEVREEKTLPYSLVPGWPQPAVLGHAGKITVGRLGFFRAAFLRGRAHLYEGFDKDRLEYPICCLAKWGVRVVILTCAAGAVSEQVVPGSVVQISRILDFQSMSITGQARQPRILDLAQLGRGCVYAAVPGPHYETPLEVLVLRRLGADVVGMSCAVEAGVTVRLGLFCVGIAVVTNVAGCSVPADADLHQQVIDLDPEVVALFQQRLVDCWPILNSL